MAGGDRRPDAARLRARRLGGDRRRRRHDHAPRGAGRAQVALPAAEPRQHGRDHRSRERAVAVLAAALRRGDRPGGRGRAREGGGRRSLRDRRRHRPRRRTRPSWPCAARWDDAGSCRRPSSSSLPRRPGSAPWRRTCGRIGPGPCSSSPPPRSPALSWRRCAWPASRARSSAAPGRRDRVPARGRRRRRGRPRPALGRARGRVGRVRGRLRDALGRAAGRGGGTRLRCREARGRGRPQRRPQPCAHPRRRARARAVGRRERAGALGRARTGPEARGPGTVDGRPAPGGRRAEESRDHDRRREC